MSLGQVWIQFQRLFCFLPRLRVAFVYRHVARIRLTAVDLGQPHPGARIIRVDLQRLLIVADRLLQIFLAPPVEEVASLQVGVVGFGICLLCFWSLASFQRHLQRSCHRCGNVILNGKDVFHLPVVGL